MRTVRMLGGELVELIDLPIPEPSGPLVVVKIMASTICGSEMHGYRAPEAHDNNGGHEAVGVVWKTDSARYVKEGDRVSLFAQSSCGRCVHCLAGNWVLCESPAPARFPGNHSQYVLLDERHCLPLPEDISFETGTLLGDALGTPLRAIKRLRLNALDTVLITGLGPVGLGATLLARFFNATVIAVDPIAFRRFKAKELGADHTFDPTREDAAAAVKEITGGLGVDVAMDCSGNTDAEVLCLEVVRRGGRYAFVGENGADIPVKPSRHFIRRDLEAIGTWYFSPSEHLDMIKLFRRGLAAERLITHRFGIDQAQEAFTTFASGEAAKVVLLPWK